MKARRAGESLSSWNKRVAAHNRTMAARPGHHWRILAHSRAEDFAIEERSDLCFDELVIDHWLHIEQMTTRTWWMRVGPFVLWVTVYKSGRVSMCVEDETGATIAERKRVVP
ncbi:MAG: hypothetical protein WC683_03160 [bacterium]